MLHKRCISVYTKFRIIHELILNVNDEMDISVLCLVLHDDEMDITVISVMRVQYFSFLISVFSYDI